MAIFAIYFYGVVFMLIVGMIFNKYRNKSWASVKAKMSLWSWSLPIGIVAIMIVYYIIYAVLEILIFINLNKNIDRFNNWYENK